LEALFKPFFDAKGNNFNAVKSEYQGAGSTHAGLPLNQPEKP
jgi:hypothetical protein